MSHPMTGRPRFVAGPDGVAHAVPARGRVTRTACGRSPVDPRLAHPERERCGACLEALGFLGVGGVPNPSNPFEPDSGSNLASESEPTKGATS